MPPPVITRPGVYAMPAREYHADPVPGGSLSHSGARRLLAPSCPALYHHERVNGGAAASRAMELGTLAHAVLLGAGQEELVVIMADDYTRKAAQQARAEARAAGYAPVLRNEYVTAVRMADALAAHPIASLLLRPGGHVEQAMFWIDGELGVWRRALVDYMPAEPDALGQWVMVDYKTTKCAHPAVIGRSVHDFGYYQQHPWYQDGAAALGLHPAPQFAFIFQEKVPPYLITVVQLQPEDVERGRERNRKAIDVYRQCTEADHWPGYTDTIEDPPMPAWARYQHDAAVDRGDFRTMEELINDHH